MKKEEREESPFPIIAPALPPEVRAMMIQAAWREKDFERFLTLTLHKPEDGWDALAAIVDLHGVPDNFPDLFRKVWCRAENTWLTRRLVDKLVKIAARPEVRARLFTDEELRHFVGLPDPITIYRGAKFFNRRGRSWSLDREAAEFFTRWHRYGAHGEEEIVLKRPAVGVIVSG